MRRILVLVLVFGFILAGCTTTTESSDDGWDIPAGPVECSDTDGGKDAFNAGTVSFGEERGIDRCLGDGEMVMEYYCSGGQMKSDPRGDHTTFCPSDHARLTISDFGSVRMPNHFSRRLQCPKRHFG